MFDIKNMDELVSLARDMSILYVEDEELDRHAVSKLFHRLFKTVSVAVNGEEGLSLYRNFRFDIVLSDVEMPVMDGISMIKEIKEINPRQTIIVTSAHTEARYLVNLINIGIQSFVIKPINMEILHGVLLENCRRVHNEREAKRYRENFANIFDNYRDALILIDADYRIVDVNKYGGELLQISIPEAIGKSIEWIAKDSGQKCIEQFKQIIESGHKDAECSVEYFRRDGTSIFLKSNAYPIYDFDSNISGFFLIITDETNTHILRHIISRHNRLHNIIGQSQEMRGIYSLIYSVADLPTTILITGESGTGKELVAEAIHYIGIRSGRPFVKINCAALSENLLESELFGHVKGAFTGAIRDVTGRFMEADTGTIFLDEIGDISPSMQVKLLRVIQEKEFYRVGDSRPQKVDVRVIAATNRDMKERVKSGDFREDLYYRLNVFEINVPPLRVRRSDISILSAYFIERYSKVLKKEIIGLSNDVYNRFMEYNWPGNIRELSSVLERAVILAKTKLIQQCDLPQDLFMPLRDFRESIVLSPARFSVRNSEKRRSA